MIFTVLTVKEIAEKLGFSDQSSFGKFFKKESGTSPTNFRDGYKKIPQLIKKVAI